MVFKSPLSALNFYENSNTYIAPDCTEPLLLQIVAAVFVGVASPPEEMSEKEAGEPPSSSGQLQLPHCICCLLLLDETFSGIEGFRGDPERLYWPESQKICATCKSLRQKKLQCYRCQNEDDIWYYLSN